MTGVDVFVSLVDIVVIATALAILIYVLVAGASKRYRQMPPGGSVIATGVVVAAIAHISDLLYGFMVTDAGLAPALSSSFFSASWLHWGLSRTAFALIAIGLVMLMFVRRKMEHEVVSRNALVEDLRSSRNVSDRRFRYLFDSTTDSVYCYRFDMPLSIYESVATHIDAVLDAQLHRANDAFVRELEVGDITEIIGQRYGELDRAKDFEAHSAMMTAFVESGYRIEDYEFNYRTLTGEDRALRVNLIGVVRKGCLERIWGVESNVLEIRLAKAELRHRQKFQKLVADVSTKLVTTPDDQASDAIRECIGRIATFFEVDRAMMFWVDDRVEERVSVVSVWSRSGINPFGGTVSIDKYPLFWKNIADNREVVRIDSVKDLPDNMAVDRQNLLNNDLKSLLVLPLNIENEIVGGMTLGRVVEEKAWGDQLVSDVSVFLDVLANSMLRFKSKRALADALDGLRNATDRLEAENVYLREEVERRQGFDEIVGENSAVLRCLHQVDQVANTRIPVLILGETGTGKELIARAIHEHSDRRNRPLVKVNCAALPANLIESELFGHEKGAFTSADSKKRGRFDLADGSTLFLDEIGEIPIELQAKLLRVLQEGEFERLGGTKTIKVDVRLVVATNRDLVAAVQTGEFRSDLFYRINTFPIELPPLRDRGDDIDLLAHHFVKLHAKRLGRNVQEISSEMMRQLRSYSWPGNIRELDGIIQRALISNSGPVVNLVEPLVSSSADDKSPRIISSTIANLKLVEREHIVAVLDEAQWKISGDNGAASQLGIPPSTLRSKMKKLGIVRPD
ncbi:MAG TPA: sigma 54-interacting transcriptional regulator [Woeseiaceae bacterium]|nr:sigma 54-interacting transcriptional regulator [Woeseiaceae bacterium]